MRNFEDIKEAGIRLWQEYPNIIHGVGAGGKIAVRVKTQEEANELPKMFEGFKLDIKVIGVVVAQPSINKTAGLSKHRSSSHDMAELRRVEEEHERKLWREEHGDNKAEEE